jgi:hypothetical protein
MGSEGPFTKTQTIFTVLAFFITIPSVYVTIREIRKNDTGGSASQSATSSMAPSSSKTPKVEPVQEGRVVQPAPQPIVRPPTPPPNVEPVQESAVGIIHNDEELRRAINDPNGPVLVEFCRPDMAICKATLPDIENVASLYSTAKISVKIYIYWIDELKQIELRSQGTSNPPVWRVYMAGSVIENSGHVYMPRFAEDVANYVRQWHYAK